MYTELQITPDTVLPLQLQPDSGTSCNQFTLRVANTECFSLIIYYPFSCNLTVIRVAIDVHPELQILSASPDTVLLIQLQPDSDSICNWCTDRVANIECFAWNCTTPSVAIRQWFELQSMYTPSCKYWVLRLILYYPFSCNLTVPRVAIDVHSELQYWVLRLICVLSLQLQPDGGSSCNRCTLRVANTKLLRISPSEWFALYIFLFWRHSN
jgi:hypothetical protein